MDYNVHNRPNVNNSEHKVQIKVLNAIFLKKCIKIVFRKCCKIIGVVQNLADRYNLEQMLLPKPSMLSPSPLNLYSIIQ